MTKNIFILTSLLLLSCATKSTDSTTERVTDSLTVSKTGAGEDFDEFFQKFTTDSLFQMDRIKFPFRVIWREEDGETTHETEKDMWTHSTFYYENSYASRQIDAYTQDIKQYRDSVVLEQRGVDNGIHVEYIFMRDNGKWVLFTGRDYSN